MNRFGLALTHFLLENDISLYKLALDAKIDRGLLYRIASGKRHASTDVLEKIAALNIAGLSLAQLHAWRALDTVPEEALQLAAQHIANEVPSLVLQQLPQGTYRVPCKGVVAAGPLTPIAKDTEIIYYAFDDMALYSPDLFCLKIQGDSMQPRFEDGGVLLVRKTDAFKNGRFYVVETDAGERTFKAFQMALEAGRLLPLNTEYAPIELKNFNIAHAYEVLEYKKSYD